MTPEVIDFRACDTTILDNEFQHIVCAKKINERKMTIFSIIRRFSRQQQVRKIQVLKCYAERGKSIF